LKTHWLDQTSRELFDQIVDPLQDLPVLLVATFRPELAPPWSGFPHVTLLTLNRLPQAQVVALVDRITGGKALPTEVLGQILARTEGVPLFTEELTKAVLEAGILCESGDRYVLAGPLPSVAIPATLHDSLMARLDRLAPVKEAAQIGACIGREFDHELLAEVVSMPEAELAAALDRLVAAELVFRRGLPPAATYIFKHALVRDAAYESLLKRRRQDLHAQIGTSIEALFPQLVEVQPELVARHFGEAGLAEKAIPCWLRAGRIAAARSANMEAIAHLRSGLECAQALSPGASRARFELSLLLALGGPLIATKGFASREAEAAYQRAQELSRELQSEPDLLLALRGLGYVYHVRANLRGATSLVDETLALAKRSGDRVLLAEADHFAGLISFHLGESQSVRERLKISADAGECCGRYHSEVYGINMSVFCRAYISHCDWHLGYPVRSLKVAEEGLALARNISHPFSIVLALNYLGSCISSGENPPPRSKLRWRRTTSAPSIASIIMGPGVASFARGRSLNLAGSMRVWRRIMGRLRSSGEPAPDFASRTILACSPGSIVRPESSRPGFGSLMKRSPSRMQIAKAGAAPSFIGSEANCCYWRPVRTLKIRRIVNLRRRSKPRCATSEAA
jgi:tetratricopeptide (TPR) repeat protein